MTKQQREKYNKNRDSLRTITLIWIAIFLGCLAYWFFLENYYNIEDYIFTSPSKFYWILWTTVLLLINVYHYCILTRITKKY